MTFRCKYFMRVRAQKWNVPYRVTHAQTRSRTHAVKRKDPFILCLSVVFCMAKEERTREAKMPKVVRSIDKSGSTGCLLSYLFICVYTNIRMCSLSRFLLLPLITTQLNCEAILGKNFFPLRNSTMNIYTFTIEHVLSPKRFISISSIIRISKLCRRWHMNVCMHLCFETTETKLTNA